MNSFSKKNPKCGPLGGGTKVKRLIQQLTFVDSDFPPGADADQDDKDEDDNDDHQRSQNTPYQQYILPNTSN